MKTDLDSKIEILETYLEDARITCLEILQEKSLRDDYKPTFVANLYDIPTLLHNIQEKLKL